MLSSCKAGDDDTAAGGAAARGWPTCASSAVRIASASEHPATTNPLAQLRAARRKPVAAIIGATAGLVPVGVYEVGHHELTSWSPIECPKALIVYAGLLFSALTVLQSSNGCAANRSDFA
jgi:hypothetical protein